MQFDPSNPIIKLCIQAIALEEKGQAEEAGKLFLKAWNESKEELEKFYTSFYVARHQKKVVDKLKWFQTALQLALKTKDTGVNSALYTVYSNIAACNEAAGDLENATKHRALASSFKDKITDTGPFYHGTKADLQIGDLLVAGNRSNYQQEIIMNHIYFTALAHGAGLAAGLAKGEGRERVYIVEPTGSFENDPNVTDKKFPGNPTRSYRTKEPLKIIGEAKDWAKQTPEELQKWREKLENNKGEIIN
jgi:tetratricopeptide (TPR) repeat protein